VDEITGYIDDHTERGLTLLERLCRQPSISAQGVGLGEMAELVSDALTEYGVQAQILPAEKGPPLVYGEIAGESPHTLLLYSHYDVQPVEPLEEWTSPPFEPTRRDGKLYARGVSDNKGDLAVRLEAIAALRAVRGALPISVKFLVEGEEESGSPNFTPAVQKYADLLSADFCLTEGGHPSPDGRPGLGLGVKGLLYVELSATGAQIDTHSANAAVVPSPSWRLVEALASLRDGDGRVLLDGFYEAVRPLTTEEEEALRAMPDDSQELRESLGLDAFLDDLEGYAWRERLLTAPTCNICGLDAGYQGPGLKTVLPASAKAKMDFRLVPDQTPEEVLGAMRAHLDRAGYEDVEIEPIAAHERPVRTSLDDPWVRTAAEALEAYYGQAPTFTINSAGTWSMYTIVDALTESVFSTPGGPGYSGSRVHAPDEHIRMDDFGEAVKVTAFLLNHFGQQS